MNKKIRIAIVAIIFIPGLLFSLLVQFGNPIGLVIVTFSLMATIEYLFAYVLTGNKEKLSEAKEAIEFSVMSIIIYISWIKRYLKTGEISSD